MDACPTCGAERNRVGVLYPARLLCPCESRSCHCGEPALIVEFQRPIKSTEPKIPSQSNDVAEFTCATHAPDDAPKPMANPVDIPRADGPRPRRKPVLQASGPNVDPAWGWSTPPNGALSTQRVRCWVCDHEHALKERTMWNGTESYCPKCNDRMYVHAWEENE